MQGIRGEIEPHAPLLDHPADDQLLLKIMSIDNFRRSLLGGYLYFNRVDCYDDDPRDGDISPRDRAFGRQQSFAAAPDWSMADYYDQCRSRSYACCFSMENSPAMWRAYGGPGDQASKIGLQISFGTLRRLMNDAVRAALDANPGQAPRWRQLLSVNYGRVQYGDWAKIQLTQRHFPNPVAPLFWKDGQRFAYGKELRVSLSAPGFGQFRAAEGQDFTFPSGLAYPFDLRASIESREMTLILDDAAAKDRLRGILDEVGIRLQTG